MADFRELLLRHAGTPCWILGGGVSLVEQIETLPARAIVVSANQHGCMARRCDYIVALDNIQPVLEGYGVPIISPKPWADYRISEHPRLDYSGQQAAWVAWLMGAHPIVLAGMDLYQGGTYHHDPDAKSTAYARSFESHLTSWRRAASIIGGTVRAVGGPLVEHGVFPRWDPAEPLPINKPPERARLLKECSGILVEFLKVQRLHGVEYLIGQVAELPREDARRLLVQKCVRLSEAMA